MKKLTKEKIQIIEDWLINIDIKFIDIRLELIDHLASEYEEKSPYVLIEDFLQTKQIFIKNYIKQRQKAIHWSYQKQFFQKLLMFFHKPTYVLVSVCLFCIVSWFVLKLGVKATLILFVSSVAILQFGAMQIHFKQYKSFKKLQLAQPLLSVLSLPSLFLYCFSLIKDFITENQVIFIVYVFTALLFNLAGFMEVRSKNKLILNKYISLFQ